jgi:hypothetical protein
MSTMGEGNNLRILFPRNIFNSLAYLPQSTIDVELLWNHTLSLLIEAISTALPKK